MNGAQKDFAWFCSVLLTIAAGLYLLRVTLQNSPTIRYGSKAKVSHLGVAYTLVFAISSGLLNYMGFSHLMNYILTKTSDRSLAAVISASIVIFFCFLYSAELKQILMVFFEVSSIPHGLESNLEGYVLGRILLVAGLLGGLL